MTETDVSAIVGLTGSTRIVFDELAQLIRMGESASIMKLALLTNYHYFTVWRALRHLRDIGLIEVTRPRNGAAPAKYVITVEV